MRYLIKSFVCLVLFITTSSFQQSAQSDAYAAYLSGSMQLWDRTIQNAVAQYKSSGSEEDRFQLALAMYGGLSATMKDQNEDFFNKYVGDAMDHLDDMVDGDYRAAECMAIKSGIYGFKIAYSPWKGMFLGPKSGNNIEDAMEADPNSAIVQKLYGNYKFFTPETWGGDREEAIKAYEKSIALYEGVAGSESDWMRLDTYAWLGQAYQKAGENNKAKDTYLASLELEKDFNWVNYVLLPQVAQ